MTTWPTGDDLYKLLLLKDSLRFEKPEQKNLNSYIQNVCQIRTTLSQTKDVLLVELNFVL